MNSETNETPRQDDTVACPWCNAQCQGKHWNRGRHFETLRGRKCKLRAEAEGFDFSDPEKPWKRKAIILEKSAEDESIKKSSKKKRARSGPPSPSSFPKSA